MFSYTSNNFYVCKKLQKFKTIMLFSTKFHINTYLYTYTGFLQVLLSSPSQSFSFCNLYFLSSLFLLDAIVRWFHILFYFVSHRTRFCAHVTAQISSILLWLFYITILCLISLLGSLSTLCTLLFLLMKFFLLLLFRFWLLCLSPRLLFHMWY